MMQTTPAAFEKGPAVAIGGGCCMRGGLRSIDIANRDNAQVIRNARGPVSGCPKRHNLFCRNGLGPRRYRRARGWISLSKSAMRYETEPGEIATKGRAANLCSSLASVDRAVPPQRVCAMVLVEVRLGIEIGPLVR